MALVAAQPAFAQTSGSTAEATADDAETDPIVVIGSRRADRSAADSSSPVDVIGAEELAGQPAANMLDVVRNLVPSFYVPQNTISDASTFVRPPSLRGLGADQILVMINGKRYNRSALVQVYSGADTALSYGSQGSDIANIPAIAISNLQVLRDGATAQYGSDAIAGVINYQLRRDTGFDVQALYGQTYEGDGERWQIAAVSSTFRRNISTKAGQAVARPARLLSNLHGRSPASKAASLIFLGRPRFGVRRPPMASSCSSMLVSMFPIAPNFT
jgi:iron complex outermembrane recepter protein